MHSVLERSSYFIVVTSIFSEGNYFNIFKLRTLDITPKLHVFKNILSHFYVQRIVFYCHFPDQLLTDRRSYMKKVYRYFIDKCEEITTGMADKILVNSNYTGEKNNLIESNNISFPTFLFVSKLFRLNNFYNTIPFSCQISRYFYKPQCNARCHLSFIEQ